MENPDHETLEKWHKDPNNWRFWIFYYNPEDRRILVPKRTRWMGWTTNFAYTPSVVVFIVIIASAILAILYAPSKY